MISAQKLARRLKAAREASRLTQEQVAAQLGISRSSLAQMELGNRAISGFELKHLADRYGRDLREFLADEFNDADDLVALFRVHPDVAEDAKLHAVLQRCASVCREATSLESLLELGGARLLPAEYQLPAPHGKWDAIQQGQAVADLERRRLNLGHAAVWDLSEILEPLGVRCAEVPMPNDISGLFLASGEIGLCVIVNSEHHARRRAFSYAHEYCHLLLDRNRRGNVSRNENRDEVIEVRANAFAAAFLMPEEAVRGFLRALGKGQESRSVATAFDEQAPVEAQHRTAPHSQDLQLYDLVHVAHHFGVSFQMAAYRLRNLRLLTEEERDRLLHKTDDARRLQRALDLSDEARPDRRGLFRHQMLQLVLEAFRRELISRRKLDEVAQLLEISAEALDELLASSGLDSGVEMGPEDVNFPE